MKFSIAEMVKTHVNTEAKTWSHDRADTVGSSEVFACMRKIAFGKHGTPTDAGVAQSKGAMKRGDIIEAHLWVPAIEAGLPAGASFHLYGQGQRTLVDGYLSATPDGLVSGVDRDCLAHLGVPDIGSTDLVVECKSVDPRVELKGKAKLENQGQTVCQMGLIRAATNFRPNYALISYTNASFVDDVAEFAVPFDQRVYDSAKERAAEIMTCADPMDLPPEGRMSGGRECDYCPWAALCAGRSAEAVPKDQDEADASGPEFFEIGVLVDCYLENKAAAEQASQRAAEDLEKLKSRMRKMGKARLRHEAWRANFYTLAGRETWDSEKLEAFLLANSARPADFKKQGKPSDVLRITPE